jgi:PhnB protein
MEEDFMAVKPIPDGYHAITPYLVVSDGSKAIDYYKTVFAAEELFRMPMEDGKIGHAELKIKDSVVMLADENAEFKGPEAVGGSPVSLMLYVEDVDKTFSKALSAGGTQLRPVVDQFYGDRSGTLRDPFGHIWTVSTHKEDVSPEEMERRMAAMPKMQ